MLVTRVGRRGREKRAGRRGREKGAESEAVIDTIQHRGGRQCDKLQVLPWLPTPMCHSRLVPCPWPKTLPFRQAKERAQKARGGDRRREEVLHEKFDQLVVYEHANTEDEKMKECVQQRRGPCVTGKANQQQSADCRGRSVRQRPGVVGSAGHSSCNPRRHLTFHPSN